MKRQSIRPGAPVLVTLGLFLSASILSACGGSGSPAQPVYGGGTGPTPTPHPTATAHATPTPTGGPATPTPTPTPPPSGGVAAACVLTLNALNKTYAFVPAHSSADSGEAPDSLAEVTIANGTTIAGTHRSAPQLARRAFHRITIPSQREHGRGQFSVVTATAVSPIITYTPPPAECAADATHDALYLESNGSEYTPSNIISVVSVNPSTAAFNFVTNFATDATGTFGYSGGTFSIAGIAYDPKTANVLISTSTGYETYSVTSPYAKTGAIAGTPSENFGYNPVTEQIFSPTYSSPSDLGLAPLSGSYVNMATEPTGIEDPDAGAVDSITNVAVSPEEFEQQTYLVNLNAATITGSTYTAPTTTLVISGPLVTDIADQSGAGLTDVAIDSANHYAFLSGEFGTTGFCVVSLPTTAGTAAPVASDYACATFPATPDAASFSAPLDPHATSTFDLGGKGYGLMFNGQDTYVAVVDLAAMMAAPRDPTDPHAVTSASSLGAIVSYVQI